MDRQKLLSGISNAATKVHRELGPGLIEPVYRSCMLLELKNRGVHYRTGVQIPISYEGRKLNGQKLTIDLLVEDVMVIELCAVDRVQDFHTRKIFTNLKLAGKPLGALINFGERLSTTAFPGFPELASPAAPMGGNERRIKTKTKAAGQNPVTFRTPSILFQTPHKTTTFEERRNKECHPSRNFPASSLYSKYENPAMRARKSSLNLE
jgi:GxxExxY protein